MPNLPVKHPLKSNITVPGAWITNEAIGGMKPTETRAREEVEGLPLNTDPTAWIPRPLPAASTTPS